MQCHHARIDSVLFLHRLHCIEPIRFRQKTHESTECIIYSLKALGTTFCACRRTIFVSLPMASWLQKLQRFQSIVKCLEQQRSGKRSNPNRCTHFCFLSLSASFHQKFQFYFSHRYLFGQYPKLIGESVRSMTIYVGVLYLEWAKLHISVMTL